MFGTCGISPARTPSTTSTIASGIRSRLATARPTIITPAMATARVKSSCSFIGLFPGRPVDRLARLTEGCRY